MLMPCIKQLGVAAALAILGSLPVVATAAPGVVHVAEQGDDSNPGTAAAPLATLDAAVARIDRDQGGEILLLDGFWAGRSRVRGVFKQPLVIRAVHAGRAVLQDCVIVAAENVVLDGIRFDGRGNSAVTNVCQVSQSRYVTLRNSEFSHGVEGHQNADALKVNDGSHHVLVERCLLFDGTDEELDILGNTHDLVFRDNVFHQVRVRKPEASASVKLNAHRVAFIGNVFANMNAEASNGGLRFGGSEQTDQRPHDLLALGNVFINNAGRCDLNLGGATRVLVADNVFLGQRGRGVIEASTNFPAGGNPNDGIWIVNNIIADPQGGLPTVYALRNGTIGRVTNRNNLFFNGAQSMPARVQGQAFADPTTERGACTADPCFIGPLEFTGAPVLAWREALRVRAESPVHEMRLAPEALGLPEILHDFYLACTTGEGPDEWYRTLLRPGRPR